MEQVSSKLRGLSPLQVGLGVLAGVVLSPLLLFIFWSVVVPLVVLVALLVVAGAAYAHFKLGARWEDATLLRGLVVARAQQILAAKKVLPCRSNLRRRLMPK